MLRKLIKSRLGLWYNFILIIFSQFLNNHISHAKIKILIWQVNVQGCPNLGHATKLMCLCSELDYSKNTLAIFDQFNWRPLLSSFIFDQIQEIILLHMYIVRICSIFVIKEISVSMTIFTISKQNDISQTSETYGGNFVKILKYYIKCDFLCISARRIAKN